MDKNPLLRKCLVAGIILLFIGLTHTPNINANNPISNHITSATYKSNITLNNGTLSGHVTDSEDNPIEGARVRVYFHDTYSEKYSDSTGYFHVTNISICNCTKNTICSKEGYNPASVYLGIWYNTIHDFVLTTKEGDWLYVGGSGPGNYSKIQDAINVSHNGDTVFVYHGTYYEHIVINKAIYLIGENVNTTTIIDNYSQESAAISIQYGNVTVMGFTINGQSTYSAIGLVSGWTTIKGNNILSLVGMVVWSYNNSILYNNITGYGLPGAGLGCGIDEILSYNRIEHNSIFSTISTGISIWGNSNVINNNLIVANGLSDIYGSKNVLSNNTFQNSGLRFYNPSENIVTNNTVNGKPLVFLDNTSNKVIDYDTAQVILVRCNNVTITNQNFSHSPDSIQVLNSTNCYIINNTISHCSGEGITIYYSDTIMVMDNTINSSWIIIGRWDSGYNNNIIVSRNTFTSDALGGYGINIENTYNCTLSYNNLVNTYIGLAYYCRNCKIWYNNFITSSYIDIYVAFFSHTTLKGNYWERPRLFPKLILGTLWKEGADQPQLLLPWFFIDWQPAQEPYDIPR